MNLPDPRMVTVFVPSKLILCSYGSSRPEGTRAELLVDGLLAWGLPVTAVHDVSSPEHGFVITRAIAIAAPGR